MMNHVSAAVPTRSVLAVFALLVLAAACARPSPEAPDDAMTVRFAIDMAGPLAEGWLDQATEQVGLRGGVRPLSWSETIPLEDPDSNGVYEGAIVFALGTDPGIAYKIKVDGAANPNDGWEVGPNRAVDRTVERVVRRAFNDSTDPLKPSYSGDIRHHEAVGTSILVPPRDLVVYVPPGYDADPDRRYPVLYMHDGQNLFDQRGAGGEWKFDESAEVLIGASEIEPVIIVGVYNTGARMDEYTPEAATVPFAPEPVGGDGRAYADYLAREVKPFIDETYRTLPGFEHTSVGGSSLGGLITMSIATWYPDVYSGYLVVSPSVWWADGLILRMVESGPPPEGRRVWLDMGTDEGPGAVESAGRLRDVLVSKGFVEGLDLIFVVDEGAAHTEAAWAARGPDMLRFLYAR